MPTTIAPYESTDTSTGAAPGAAPAALPLLTGPDQAGLNPGPITAAPATAPTSQGGVPTPGTVSQTLPPNIANALLPGGPDVGGTPGQPSRPYSERELVQAMAEHLEVKPEKGKNLETLVIEAVSKKLGVKIPQTYEGTGNKQGTIGSLRHDIASWYDMVARGQDAPLAQGLDKAASKEVKSKSGKSIPPEDFQKAPGADNPRPSQPDETPSAVTAMLKAVDEKLGINAVPGSGGDIADIAKGLGVTMATTALPGTTGGQQTAAQAYVAFTKGAFSNGKLTAEGTQWATDLENAGYLDKNANNSAPTSSQVAAAYQQALTDSVTNKTSLTVTLQNKATAEEPPGGQTGPTSEMTSYVQGVAGEFGIALTPDQINSIANQYGSTALTAASPSSVEDEIKNAVVQYYDPNNLANPPGVANTMFTKIQQAALAYQIPISDQAIGTMVTNALKGATVESMYVAADAAAAQATQLFQAQAAGLYPTLAKQIEAGQDVQTLVAPYYSVAEQYTGVPASTMMTEGGGTSGPSKWSAFLQGGTDPKTGAPTTQTLDQWKKTLMQDPQYGFQKTQGAKDMAAQFSSALLNEFGLVSTQSSSTPFSGYSGTPGSANTT